MALLLQILGSCFVLFMLYVTYYNYKRKDLSSTDLFIWSCLWVVLALLVLFPEFSKFFFQPLKVQGALQFIILFSLGILFLVAFNNYLLIKRNEKKLTKLISKTALKQYHETKKDHDRRS